MVEYILMSTLLTDVKMIFFWNLISLNSWSMPKDHH